MKKTITLLFTLLLLTGCYDYKEVNKMAFVSAIGIDFIDDEYQITLELLNDEKEQISSYTTTSKDKSLAIAIEKATSLVSKEANYSHIKLMIISKNIADNKLDTLFDFFLRSTYFRENFYIISSLDTTPEKVLNTKNKDNKVASEAIINLLENNKYASNCAVLKTFDKVVEEIITKGIDTSFSNINVSNDNFYIDGLSIFSNYYFKEKLNNNESTLYNILTNNFYRPIFSKEYEESIFSVAIATSNHTINISKDNILIYGDITGKVMDNDANFDIKNLDTINNINDDFSIILNTSFEEFIKKLQNLDSDILGITKKHYQKTREDNPDLWKYLKVKSNTSFYINKKGLIYEVQK